MNAKISVFVICVEAFTYLLLYNLRDCTFKVNKKTSERRHGHCPGVVIVNLEHISHLFLVFLLLI